MKHHRKGKGRRSRARRNPAGGGVLPYVIGAVAGGVLVGGAVYFWPTSGLAALQASNAAATSSAATNA